jgi:hypothetical protein
LIAVTPTCIELKFTQNEDDHEHYFYQLDQDLGSLINHIGRY